MDKTPVLSWPGGVPQSTIEEHAGTYCSSALYTARASSSREFRGSYVVHRSDGDAICTIGLRGRSAYVFPVSPTFNDFDVVDYIESNCLDDPDLQSVVYKRIPASPAWDPLRERVGRRLVDGDLAKLEDESTPDLYVELSDDFPSTLTSQSRSLRRNLHHFQRSRAESGLDLSVDRDLNRVCGLTGRELLRLLCNRSREKLTAYSIMCAAISVAHQTEHIRSWTFSSAGRVVGLYIADLIDERTCGLYCAVTGSRARGWTEYMDLQVLGELRHAYDDKVIERVLIGGCETAGVEEYVDKLRPRTDDLRTVAFATAPLRGQQHEDDWHDHADHSDHEADQCEMAAS